MRNAKGQIVAVMMGRHTAQGYLVSRSGNTATVDIGGRHVSGICVSADRG